MRRVSPLGRLSATHQPRPLPVAGDYNSQRALRTVPLWVLGLQRLGQCLQSRELSRNQIVMQRVRMRIQQLCMVRPPLTPLDSPLLRSPLAACQSPPSAVPRRGSTWARLPPHPLWTHPLSRPATPPSAAARHAAEGGDGRQRA